ncbi:MAG TPA: SDR family NAD(P)-dependent oxidoreductase [Acidobacteriaceae bacterium]|nr:SDR family NAD(P)-dependent oxidoreductase [Acidobacteriaceae bacterium]
MSERLALVAEGKREAAGKLRAWLRGEPLKSLYTGHVGAGQRGVPEADALAAPERLAEAWVQGAKVDWETRRGQRRLRRAQLPSYAFQRERYWIEERAAPETAGEPARGALLGRRLQVAGVRAQYEARLRSDDWIGEHEVEGEAVLPATGHMELMLEAGVELLGTACVLEDVTLEARLGIDGERRVQVAVEEESGGRSRVRLYAERDGGWERVSEGWLRAAEEFAGERIDVTAVRDRLAESAGGETFYAEMEARGIRFGERFRGVERLWSGDSEALGEIALKAGAEGPRWQAAPWWLDACLQVAGAAVKGEGLYLPLSAERVEIRGQPGERSWSHVRTRRVDARTVVAEVNVFDSDGSPLARLSGLRFRRVTSQHRPEGDSLLYRVRWERAERTSTEGSAEIARGILVLGENEPAFRLSAQLKLRGLPVRHSSVNRWLAAPESDDDDCVVWVADPENDFHPIPGGAVTEGVAASIRSLLSTAQRLAGQRSAARLYVVTTKVCSVTQEPSAIHLTHAPLSGMAAAIAAEYPESRCTLLDLEIPESDPARVAAEVLAAEVLAAADDRWVAWRSGARYAAKLERLHRQLPNPANSTPLRLETQGGIDALAWSATSRRDLQPDEVEIAVHATALNFHDVLQVLGVLPDEGPPGTDCAGVVLRTGDAVADLSPGDAVVAIAPGCFATHAIAPRSLVVQKPASLSFAEAAGQTVAYLTAAWCLEEIAQVRPGETVLIHAAAGGVGLAAVHLCRKLGAEVIATAGSEAKRAYLRGLGIRCVYDSRSLEFASQIPNGVDVVLNSLAGAAIDRGLSLLRPGGRFVELGRTDRRDARSLAGAWPAVRYVPVDLTPLFAEGSPWVRDRMATLFRELENGQTAALPVTVYPSAQVKGAFRFMARAGHIGRVVVENSEDFSGTHIVTGGMRGVGLAVAEWLARSGANSLVLMGRSEPTPEAQQVIGRIRDAGTTVEIVQGDIADPATAQRAVADAGNNLRGIWHAASVLDNRALQEQTWESMLPVLRPKAEGAWNLHVASAGRKLKYFVLFSSWASIGGSHGQVNYCAANAFLDGLASFRRMQGLPALSVNWGAWRGLGLTATSAMQHRLARAGMESMSPEEALEGLRGALAEGDAQVAVANVNWQRYLSRQPEGRRDPFYANVAGALDARKQELSGAEAPRSGRAQISVASETDLLRIVGDTVRRTLAFHDQEQIDPEVPLSDLGMDSLLAVDLRNSLANTLKRQLPSTLLFDYPTINALMTYLRSSTAKEIESRTVPATERTAQPRNSLSFLTAIEQMSDDQVEDRIEKHSGV